MALGLLWVICNILQNIRNLLAFRPQLATDWHGSRLGGGILAAQDA